MLPRHRVFAPRMGHVSQVLEGVGDTAPLSHDPEDMEGLAVFLLGPLVLAA